MSKRLISMVVSLIMAVCLLPMGAVTVSASGFATGAIIQALRVRENMPDAPSTLEGSGIITITKGATNTYTAVIRVSVTDVPAGANVDSAELTMYCHAGANNGTSATIGIYELVKKTSGTAWSETGKESYNTIMANYDESSLPVSEITRTNALFNNASINFDLGSVITESSPVAVSLRCDIL